MNYLLDTNIFVQLSKSKKPSAFLKSLIEEEDARVYLSIITLAEARSIAFRNAWGETKWNILDSIIKRLTVVDINESLLNAYSQVDAYSQRRNPAFHDYEFATPRNMGKNDLWIAATSALLGLTLVTTDKDFDHLHKVFMEVKRITPETFM
jgi:tRNA(fMet)-specific endonuclease VapC